MADEAAQAETEDTKTGKLKPILIGLVLAVMLGAAGFYATYSGLMELATSPSSEHTGETTMPDVAFVAVDPILVSFTGAGQSRHLRFRANLEVESAEAGSVQAVMPRILDVLNSYLRALDLADLERPTALIRIRAQMLRRIQLVVGDGRVRDLLVTEFVMN